MLLNKLPIILIAISIGFTSLLSSQYSFRKYPHVKNFYYDICVDVIEIGVKNNIPPAAIMAIAGLESGYGRGYVAQITGNILSLGAFKGDKELPRLYLPYSKSNKVVIFDKKIIKKHQTGDLFWQTRPKNLKRDYRPVPHAGTVKNLELLKYDKNLKRIANRACINDFATRWIVSKSKVKVFRDAKLWLNRQVSLYGVGILFEIGTNEHFIDMIGGHPHSFNYRDGWPKKTKLIMKKVGLIELARAVHIDNMDFNKAWSNK
ncbi:glucosaminidase domain-containing protein [Candidatus Sulfurimonas marisnigri]|uniref:Glucosaminidase domain-containing protein n=1 Tax=Candidatus Sulfurimonas marisnigri TaxID=2740405 RepID=A0A7S7RPH8_9BACT|nr:glucosaminidase domain-containing protein [Candidatus Sulfurimonas marisnigri]QOY53606.1 glucosaminidase domain-containing protein [Candidatus Sulfurimonas marisnigri]